MAQSSGPALPENLYIQRTAAAEGRCFICNALTATLLITEKHPVDWFYICQSHLRSNGFCTMADVDSSSYACVSTVAPDSVDTEPMGSSNKGSDELDNTIPAGNVITADDKGSSNGSRAASDINSDGAGTPAVATKPMYILHSDYFYLRKRPFILRWEQEQEYLFGKQLPSVPHNRLS
ncbi:hypothetical protein COEREDRAFT_80112 [Coemansia reversa NRRL 1564]|uniref:DUF1742-domain-containing protein n=1 Tax=Coemansia reversa (strain ATCC 12441 / NRRL 1564) TaxID=763665 RepID=A0A2G5BHJ9_COERN|nr:hypothetical protein COEREDRAFT_80112 [Coemansia reversa NRRL 1564]|eukprot:PIA18207.1 hypothetical protein COEREDRAFT_80112 [Coemansia reversa NRRL 1564]